MSFKNIFINEIQQMFKVISGSLLDTYPPEVIKIINNKFGENTIIDYKLINGKGKIELIFGEEGAEFMYDVGTYLRENRYIK